MVSVDFKDRIGYYTLHSQDGQNKWKIWFCRANCLVAEIYFYKDENGEDMAKLHSFFGDVQHVKNCAKAKVLTGYDKGVTLYAKKMNSELWKMAQIFAENGIKVTIK
jgi:hypothetical protein